MKIPSLPNLSRRTWTMIIVILVILAAIPGLGLVRFTSSHDLVCLNCHQNQDPREMWLPSRSHPASVACVDCHLKSGAGFSIHFSASDDLMNQRCLGCHPAISGGEQTDLQSVRIVKISHKLHAEKKALCIDCHRNIGHDTQSPRTNRPRMETCYQCHEAHPRTQACDKCHPINLVYTKK